MTKRRAGLIALDLVMILAMILYTAYDIETDQAAWAALASCGATIWAFNLLHEVVDPS